LAPSVLSKLIEDVTFAQANHCSGSTLQRSVLR
jgi:hypothetical protein